jgi:hypothetical protein
MRFSRITYNPNANIVININIIRFYYLIRSRNKLEHVT